MLWGFVSVVNCVFGFFIFFFAGDRNICFVFVVVFVRVVNGFRIVFWFFGLVV